MSVKTVPLSGSLSTKTVPRWSSRIHFTMESPRPVPERPMELEARQNRFHIIESSSFGIPTPVSFTRTVQTWFSEERPMETVPPSQKGLIRRD